MYILEQFKSNSNSKGAKEYKFTILKKDLFFPTSKSSVVNVGPEETAVFHYFNISLHWFEDDICQKKKKEEVKYPIENSRIWQEKSNQQNTV